mmetsp:Transcript_15185/g.23452  ORF Transcript_15185/g.23452 Transcript_15185/m.23452 type:complete len:139 (-) Transcript_15185:33-449(-)
MDENARQYFRDAQNRPKYETFKFENDETPYAGHYRRIIINQTKSEEKADRYDHIPKPPNATTAVNATAPQENSTAPAKEGTPEAAPKETAEAAPKATAEAAPKAAAEPSPEAATLAKSKAQPKAKPDAKPEAKPVAAK